ncbi:MAG TPA: LCP family protein [Candidatus Saccharimonadales bacterium]|nr:LCP family protein [Candidatus Saccharimonadales bacterium]
MPRTKKPSRPADATRSDADFERMYQTIPNDYGRRKQAAQDEAGQPEQKPGRRKKIIKRIILIIIIIAALWGAWVGWKFLSNSIRIFGWGGLQSLITTKELKGEKEGRVTLLLAGNSTDDPGHSGAALTDSIMVVSIDTKNKAGYIMSIPRDLYVDIPGYGYAKINEAYQDGEDDNFSETGYAPGGMGLLQKTVSQALGTDIQYYALVNYSALREAVNAVGGVTVTIDSTDPRGLYDPSPDLANNRLPLVKLPNGSVTLDGNQALGLARARGQAKGSYGFGLSDFTRTQHQRQLLIGLKEKAASASTLSNPVKLGELFDSFGSNIETDLSLGEARRLYAITKPIDSAKIVSASLNNANEQNLLESYRTRTGQSALVPRQGVDDYSEIQAYVDSLEATPEPAAP